MSFKEDFYSIGVFSCLQVIFYDILLVFGAEVYPFLMFELEG